MPPPNDKATINAIATMLCEPKGWVMHRLKQHQELGILNEVSACLDELCLTPPNPTIHRLPYSITHPPQKTKTATWD